MRKRGIKNYKKFAKEILKKVKIKPVSFEIFADEAHEIEALQINTWGKNVFVKIPIIFALASSNVGKLL